MSDQQQNSDQLKKTGTGALDRPSSARSNRDRQERQEKIQLSKERQYQDRVKKLEELKEHVSTEDMI